MIYTSIADANGDFTINIESALTNGEVVQVTAHKNGQSKSINIQAPSEPYNNTCEPPISGGGGDDDQEISAGFVVDFPPNADIFGRIINLPPEYIFSNVWLYTSAALSINNTNNISLIKNKIMPVIDRSVAYVAFRIPFSDILSATPKSFGYIQGSYDAATDTATYRGDVGDMSISFFKSVDFAFSDFTVDDKYVYFILSNEYLYSPATNSFTDGVYNYCYKVVYGSQEYEARFKFGHPE